MLELAASFVGFRADTEEQGISLLFCYTGRVADILKSLIAYEIAFPVGYFAKNESFYQ